MKYYAERTVVSYNENGHKITLARYHATLATARRLGWRPGVTHCKTVGNQRYVFHDGNTASNLYVDSQFIPR